MTPIAKLERLAGGTRALASILAVDPSLVTRWKKPRLKTVDDQRHTGNDGRLPPKHNRAIRLWAANLSANMGDFDTAAQAIACLDADVCPTCGQPLPEGQVV